MGQHERVLVIDGIFFSLTSQVSVVIRTVVEVRLLETS